jgi:hypothetical protein
MNQVLEDLSSLRYNRYYRIWKPFMQKYNCQTICEIGIRQGRNFNKMISHQPKLAVAVDIWRDDGVKSRNDKGSSQAELDKQYEDFIKGVEGIKFVRVYREYSFDAVKHFPDNFFDLVYIDADHAFEGCYRDICDWYPKVKKNGFLLGDDYKEHLTMTRVKFGVIRAVNKFTRENNLSYFVFPISKWGLIK